MAFVPWRGIFRLLAISCLLFSWAGATPLGAQSLRPDQLVGLQQPSTPSQLGDPPSLTPAQVRSLTTVPRALVAPRAPGQSRADVVGLFNTQYTPALAVPADWTGSVAGCVPGSTSTAFETATIQMVNYFRTMAGLPNVTLDATRTVGAQSAALMMKAQGDLSHNPPPTWACFTDGGAASAAKSNLFLGRAGASAVAGYVDDEGVANLGHRRWIIYPPQTQMGTGSTDNTNALDVVGGFGQRPATPEFVSWPPPGFVPYQVVYNTWSLAFPNAEFANATVTMTTGGAPVQLTVVQLPTGFGDPGISWRPTGLGTGAGVADKTFTVTVANVVVGGAPRTFTYDVTVIDPAQGGGGGGTPPAPTPPAPTPCAPRPRPTMTVTSVGAGRVRATITVGTGNTFSSVRFGAPGRLITNATVDVQGVAAGVTSGQTVALPAGTTVVTLNVSRLAAGSAIVPLVLVDNCGDWPTFVGMGAGVP